MNEAEALEYFAKYLEKPCSDCGKSPGELCDSNSVWRSMRHVSEQPSTPTI